MVSAFSSARLDIKIDNGLARDNLRGRGALRDIAAEFDRLGLNHEQRHVVHFTIEQMKWPTAGRSAETLTILCPLFEALLGRIFAEAIDLNDAIGAIKEYGVSYARLGLEQAEIEFLRQEFSTLGDWLETASSATKVA